MEAYTLVTPLEESPQPPVSESHELSTQCFKAWCPRTSSAVLLRRVILPVGRADASFEILSNRLSNEKFALTQQIRSMNHPSLVHLLDVKLVNEFGDNCEYYCEFDDCLLNEIVHQALEHYWKIPSGYSCYMELWLPANPVLRDIFKEEKSIIIKTFVDTIWSLNGM